MKTYTDTKILTTKSQAIEAISKSSDYVLLTIDDTKEVKIYTHVTPTSIMSMIYNMADLVKVFTSELATKLKTKVAK